MLHFRCSKAVRQSKHTQTATTNELERVKLHANVPNAPLCSGEVTTGDKPRGGGTISKTGDLWRSCRHIPETHLRRDVIAA